MNMELIDWLIFAGLFIGLNLSAYLCRNLVKGVAGFLVAGRNVGRYLGLGADSMSGLGAVTILAMWQMNYKSGFAGGLWWYLLMPVAAIVVALTGFGVYRFRQTRAMTLGQFIEMRYSKNTRILFGSLAYLAGVINMGVFPVIAARFFVYYCGLPPEITIAQTEIPTVLLIMLLLVGSSVAICFWGGQVTLIITNFLQSIFINIMLVVIMIVIYKMFTWEQFSEAFQSASSAESLLHPYRGKGVEGFDKAFFLIYVYWMFYRVIDWAPQTMQVGSARDAHEAKMMRIMVEVRRMAMVGLGIGVLPLAAFVLMNHPDFASQASQVNQALDSITNEQIRSQMLTPAAVIHILPAGLIGAFAGFVLFACISTHDSYLLAWGGLLVQDVILPLRGKALSPKRHLLWIRISVLFVAVFIIAFGMLYKQVDNIFMFFDISAAPYITAAGIVLLGGLYWKRGTIKAVWVTMITGAVLSITGLVYRSLYPEGLDGRRIAFLISAVCIILYVVVSLLDRFSAVDLDKILNREKQDEDSACYRRKRKWFQWGREVSKGDRILISGIIAAIVLFVGGFIGCWIYNLLFDVPTASWANFWHVYLYAMFFLGSAFVLWIIIGGIRDMARLFRSLKTQEENIQDDGSVKEHLAAE